MRILPKSAALFLGLLLATTSYAQEIEEEIEAPETGQELTIPSPELNTEALAGSEAKQAESAHNNEAGPEIALPSEDDASKQDEVVSVPSVQLGGYGEMHYSALFPEEGQNANEIDFHRFVLYVGKQFNPNLSFHSELEIEHAIVGNGKPGEVSVEQAYLDYTISGCDGPLGPITLRTGIVLVPMGIVNLEHEPTTFHGVERPNVDKLIIPSTWREGAVGLVGRANDTISYELYLMGGLNPLGFSGKKGIRGGRQKVGEAKTDGLAIAARINLSPSAKTTVGLSGYFNPSGKNADTVNANVNVIGSVLNAKTRWQGFEAKAEFAYFHISDTDTLNAVTGSNVADQLLGGYIEVAYDLLFSEDTEKQVLPFSRIEYYSTDPDNEALQTIDAVVGLTFRPIPQVAFKSDLLFRTTAATGGDATILNLGMAFLY